MLLLLIKGGLILWSKLWERVIMAYRRIDLVLINRAITIFIAAAIITIIIISILIFIIFYYLNFILFFFNFLLHSCYCCLLLLLFLFLGLIFLRVWLTNLIQVHIILFVNYWNLGKGSTFLTLLQFEFLVILHIIFIIFFIYFVNDIITFVCNVSCIFFSEILLKLLLYQL